MAKCRNCHCHGDLIKGRCADCLVPRLEAALRYIVSVLGPEPIRACGGCQGCHFEMEEALKIAKKALKDLEDE